MDDEELERRLKDLELKGRVYGFLIGALLAAVFFLWILR